MNKNLLVLAAFLLFISTQILGQTTFSMNLSSGGITRNLRLYIPAAYTGQEARPLVFQFHGSGSTNTLNFQNLTNFTKVADTANFILVTPQGTYFPNWNWTDWNAYETVNNGVDDVLFVRDMIDTLTKAYNIDTTRIYTSGWSAGACFSYYLGWKLSDRIAAAGSVCGGFEDSTYLKMMPPAPFPVMEIHGTQDPFLPLSGGTTQGQVWIPLDSLMNFWVENNACNPVPTVTDMPNTITTDGCSAKRYVWANGACGSEVQLIKVTGGKHTWPKWNNNSSGTCKDFFADVELWRFFRNHQLGCNTTVVKEPQPTPEIALWPNPTTDYLQVSFPGNQNTSSPDALVVADYYGKILLRKPISSTDFNQTLTLDLGEIPAGGYILMAETAGRRWAFRHFILLK